ncbi:MAG: hypothetical protein ACI9JY_000670, partial [Saprospiraceae bacterium]
EELKMENDKIVLILLFALSLTTVSFGQSLYLKGGYIYFPVDGQTILYGLALEKEFQNLWSFELGTSVSVFDETRNDGDLIHLLS